MKTTKQLVKTPLWRMGAATLIGYLLSGIIMMVTGIDISVYMFWIIGGVPMIVLFLAACGFGIQAWFRDMKERKEYLKEQRRRNR